MSNWLQLCSGPFLKPLLTPVLMGTLLLPASGLTDTLLANQHLPLTYYHITVIPLILYLMPIFTSYSVFSS